MLEIIPIEKQFLFMWVWSLSIIICEHHVQKQLIKRYATKSLHHAEYFICGVVLSIRHYNNKICIWTCNQNEETNLKIGRLFKKNCELNNNDKIQS